MNRNLLGLCILGCSIVSGAANAQTVGQVGYRNITYLVCGKNDTTCAVGITGTPVGPVGCSPGRWAFNATTPAGKVQHANLLTAYALRKTLRVVGTASCPDLADTESVSWFNTVD